MRNFQTPEGTGYMLSEKPIYYIFDEKHYKDKASDGINGNETEVGANTRAS